VSEVPADDVRQWITQHLDPLDANTGPGKEAERVPDGWDWDLAEPARPAAVLIGLVEREQGMTVLLTRRADTLRSHTGQVALPGGRCDPGETPWETALREAEEEIGLSRRFVTPAGLGTPYLTGTAYLVTPVVGFITPGFTLRPNPDEVAEIFETPFAFIMDLANHEEREHELGGGRTRRYFAMTHDEKTIWGVTAGILRSLYFRLYGAAVA